MNVGKLRKKWECLLLLWLGHHYLLMSNNINTPTAVAIPLPGSIPTKITLPTVTATSCHEIYSIQGSPTSNTTVYLYYRNCTEDSSSHHCFKSFIICSSEPEVNSASNSQSEPQRSCFYNEYNESQSQSRFGPDTYFENRGQVCGVLQSNHTCGKDSRSLCLNLRSTSVQETETDVMEDTISKTFRMEKESRECNICVCERGFKGPKCSQLDSAQFHKENINFDASLAEFDRRNQNKGKNSWMVGIALVIFISITFLGVIGIIAGCIYLFIKNAIIAHLQSIIDSRRQSAIFSADFLQEDIQPRCKFSDFKFCCGRLESDFDGMEIEMDEIEVD